MTGPVSINGGPGSGAGYNITSKFYDSYTVLAEWQIASCNMRILIKRCWRCSPGTHVKTPQVHVNRHIIRNMLLSPTLEPRVLFIENHLHGYVYMGKSRLQMRIDVESRPVPCPSPLSTLRTGMFPLFRKRKQGKEEKKTKERKNPIKVQTNAAPHARLRDKARSSLHPPKINPVGHSTQGCPSQASSWTA